ncbi:MAG: SDR family oxidoreductase [Deltaproteobacteria bacterium]|nr:SDR family oxidoreductase [Deltaproteobacteria bacterium]MBW2388819.1 SDR family oxidoreductase [Deltaproteobacteria bacterium]MBW2726276.1 SDR family oxidoreductase [Deltaproteobacteria bacterium]
MVLDPQVLSLADRVALITGAGAGIGQSTAICLASFGASVALCDRDGDALAQTAKLIEEQGGEAFCEVLDVREHADVERFVGHVADRFEHIDILVNNAGGTFQSAFQDVSERGQQALVDLNFTSVTQLVRASLPHMHDRSSDREPSRNGPSIVNITSIEAHRAAPGYAIYAAMKAAVVNLSMSLALELGDRNIRVNCVAPDMIPTPGTGPMDYDTPLRQRGQVDDVAGAVLYLVSPLSAFVTGSTIHVDGGNAAAGGWRRNEKGGFDLR